MSNFFQTTVWSANVEEKSNRTETAIIFVTGELVALPLCFSGADGLMSGDWKKAVLGFGTGIPIGVIGLTYRSWAGKLSSESRAWIQREGWKWWIPFAAILAYTSVIVPDFYHCSIEASSRVGIFEPPISQPANNTVPPKALTAVGGVEFLQMLNNLQKPCEIRITSSGDNDLAGSLNWILTSGGFADQAFCRLNEPSPFPDSDDGPQPNQNSSSGVIVHWNSSFTEGVIVAGWFRAIGVKTSIRAI